jgi:hypothetical protein
MAECVPYMYCQHMFLSVRVSTVSGGREGGGLLGAVW